MNIRTFFARSVITAAVAAFAALASCSAGQAPSSSVPPESSAQVAPGPSTMAGPATTGPPTTAADAADAAAEMADATGAGVTASPATDAIDVSTSTDASTDSPNRIQQQLVSGGLLVDDRILLSADTRPDSATVAALCDYLFGPAAEATARAALPATTELMPASGVRAAEKGRFVLCAYGHGDRVLAVLEIGHSADAWDAGITTLVQDGDVHAVLSYVPDFGGTPLAPADATTWLRDALTRLDY